MLLKLLSCFIYSRNYFGVGCEVGVRLFLWMAIELFQHYLLTNPSFCYWLAMPLLSCTKFLQAFSYCISSLGCSWGWAHRDEGREVVEVGGRKSWNFFKNLCTCQLLTVTMYFFVCFLAYICTFKNFFWMWHNIHTVKCVYRCMVWSFKKKTVYVYPCNHTQING